MKKIFVSLFALLLITACAREDIWDVDKVRAMPSTADSIFHDQLKYEYTELAAAERSEGDWEDTVVFLERAKAAAAGETMMPEAEGYREIQEKWIKEVTNSRMRMERILGDKDAVKKRPREAALALAGFDCWMQEIEEDHQEEDIAACRAQFEAAMVILENDGCGPHKYIAYFDFDKANLTKEARKILNNAITYSKTIKATRAPKFVIAGHADTMGSKSYNKGLSRRRALAVMDYMTAKGVNAKNVKVEFYGEEKLAVLTPDQTMEPRNRRATIDVK